MADIPDELIKLERSAEEARAKLAGLDGEAYEAQWVRWWEAAVVFQAAVTVAAAQSGTSRVELEMKVKKAVRHAAAA
ncbi:MULTISPECIES: hypothetical protein [unclassified Streptomyces]|uniref:hypothetical protein n=1 Tax=unclassified Streptomyces TaxID=2593676 RepID=UPI002253940D|nr:MULTISPECIES: hypothetical protein [unclassified Streptomyces]MCX5327881.1 hypothetical protein [Streptomyces sp. NBC_00140]MCX5357370.1 hypothetical protein [Streptomyces sp. NBC_00124]